MKISPRTYPMIALAAALLAAASPLRAVETAPAATLAGLLAAAREHNPSVIAARERSEAVRERAKREGIPDQPWLTAEFRGIPEGSIDPSAADEAMYGIRQMLPFPGKLGTRKAAMLREAEAAGWEYRDIELGVRADLTAAYAEYYYLTKAAATYRRNAELMKAAALTAGTLYAGGKGSVSDALRARAESGKMEAMAVSMDAEKDAMRAEINRLAARDPDAPLGEPEELSVPVAPAPVSGEVRNSPAVRKARSMAEGRAENRKAAKLDYLPDFDLSYVRRRMGGEWNGSEVMVGVSVPLWYGAKKAGVREAEHELAAARAEAADTERMAAAGLREAEAKLESSRRLAATYRATVLPAAEQAVKSSRAAYLAGREEFTGVLDSVRTHIDLQNEYYRYVADYYRNRAAAERVAGTDVAGGGQK